MNKEIAELLDGIGCNNLIRHVDELNAACEHIVCLLKESVTLFSSGSYSTSLFIAITAIEEVAKGHFGLFTAGGPDPESRKKNIFFHHQKKHEMAAQPTVGMGSRLNEALGKDRVQYLLKQSHEGSLLKLRESALYFQRVDGIVTTPRELISKEQSAEIILLAIETFDDALVGFSNKSMELSIDTDELFEEVIELDNKSE
jgi:AbiV family abortive infection protein